MSCIKYLFIIFIGTLCLCTLYGCGTIKFNYDQIQPKQREVREIDNRQFKKKRLALVLGGGGAKGFAHIGVLEELHANGIVPDVIIGCSAGAIVGALYAANPDIEALKAQVLNGKSNDIVALSGDHLPYSIYSAKPLARYLHKNLAVEQFEDLQIPLIITATDLQYGNVAVFNSGDLIPAVIASASYPGAIHPTKIDDFYYIDGGISDPLPTSIAKELGFETVIAVNIAERLPTTSPNHALGVLQRSTEIGYLSLIKNSRRYADLVIDLDFKGVDLFDDKQNKYLYERGIACTKEKIPEIIELLSKK